jgi:hypothetical protein
MFDAAGMDDERSQLVAQQFSVDGRQINFVQLAVDAEFDCFVCHNASQIVHQGNVYPFSHDSTIHDNVEHAWAEHLLAVERTRSGLWWLVLVFATLAIMACLMWR